MKSGIKTSEFWVALIAAVLPVLNEKLALNLPAESILALIAYVIGRSGVKIAEVRKPNGR